MKSNQDRIFDQMKKYHSGDPQLQSEAIEEIVADHSKYISRIINKYFYSYRHDYWNDMFQAGVVGLIDALPNYDPSASRPTTYFHFFILHEINEFVARIVHGVTAHFASRITKINRAESELQKRGILEPTITDIAMESGMQVEAVIKAKEYRTMSQPQSLETESYMDSIVHDDARQSPEQVFEMKEVQEILRSAISELKQDEKEVLIRKYGLFGNTIQSNSEISKETGIPVDAIRPCQQKAIRRLRNNPLLTSFFHDNAGNKAVEIGKQEISLAPVQTITKQMQELVDAEEYELK